ncbi:MAG: hypothetical protein SPI53_05080 [Erysipelotrichaceae bacterium]|nr:hypothetical protein [Erysipelotrichaceae bacterium]
MNFSELNKLKKDDVEKLIKDESKKMEKLKIEKQELEDFLKLKFSDNHQSETDAEVSAGIGAWGKE